MSENNIYICFIKQLCITYYLLYVNFFLLYPNYTILMIVTYVKNKLIQIRTKLTKH